MKDEGSQRHNVERYRHSTADPVVPEHRPLAALAPCGEGGDDKLHEHEQGNTGQPPGQKPQHTERRDRRGDKEEVCGHIENRAQRALGGKPAGEPPVEQVAERDKRK